MKFRKKPVVINAVQFTGTNAWEIFAFIGHPELVNNLEIQNTDHPVIRTLEGNMTASPGDWIIKGIKGEFYPCKPDIFEATYESALAQTPDSALSKVSVPWYCRKCQTENSDIRQETCDECGEDFPDGWSGTKFHVLKLLDILDQPQGSSVKSVGDTEIEKLGKEWSNNYRRGDFADGYQTSFIAGYRAALERVK